METDTAYGQVFNIGSSNEISIGDLARQVREMCGSKSEIVFVPYEKAYEEGFEDMPRRVPDTSKIEAAIGWQPSMDLPQILRDVVSYYQRGA
ncbi:MAG: hypothetical protein JNK04_00705 [Myxococcales bacterium]|nr:hypothetical protein [Myxococcales bacterium]